jgi:peptide/nickel transport system permease protein
VAQAVARRLAGAVVVLWAAVTAAFLAIHAAPGNTADILLGTTQKSPQAVAAVTAQWHLDRPWYTQYLDYVGGILHGNLGTSYQLNAPVSQVISSQLGPTAQLALAGAVVAVGLALVLSVVTAGRPWPSRIANAVEIVVVSLPEFWLAILLVFGISFRLGWFPVAGAYGFSSLVLPALSLSLGIFGMLSQLLRAGIELSLEEPYSLTARARGVSDLALRLRHSVRHAALPVVHLTGYIVGGLLGGVVIVEQVFSRPGIGQITLSAVGSKDLPVVLGVALLGAFIYVAVSTVVDILALLIDPRLRFATRRTR